MTSRARKIVGEQTARSPAKKPTKFGLNLIGAGLDTGALTNWLRYGYVTGLADERERNKSRRSRTVRCQ